MQKTVTNEKKSLFSAFLEVVNAHEEQAQANRQLQEEKYQMRIQRIYDLNERQQREAAELRRCVQYVSQHACVLESVLRGGEEAGEAVTLSATMLHHATALQRCMAQCIANASRIRHQLTASHQPQMDSILSKMKAELSTWTAFVLRAGAATCNTEMVIDNIYNLVVEQKRCMRELSTSDDYAPCPRLDVFSHTEPAAEEVLLSAGRTPENLSMVNDLSDSNPSSPLMPFSGGFECSTPMLRE